MAINSSNSSDTSAQIAQLVQTGQTNAQSSGSQAAADLAEAKSMLAANAPAYDKDTLSKVNNDITLPNSNLTQGLSLDGVTQDQHMQAFVQQVTALGITLTSSAPSSSSAAGAGVNLGNTQSSGTSSYNLDVSGDDSDSSGTTSGNTSSNSSYDSGSLNGPSYSAASSDDAGDGVSTSNVSAGSSNSASDADLTTLSAQTNAALSNFNTAIANSQKINPDKTPNTKYDSKGWKAAAESSASSYIAALKTYEGTLNVSSDSPFKAEVDTAISSATTTLQQFSSAQGDWRGESLKSALLNAGSVLVGNFTGASSSVVGQDFTKSGQTATGQDTFIVQAQVIGDIEGIGTAITNVNNGAQPGSGDAVDTGVSDLQKKLQDIYGSNVPTAVATAYQNLSALRDKWVAGDASVGAAVSDAANKLSAAIASNSGGGNPDSWGVTGLTAGTTSTSSASSTSSSSSSSSASSVPATSANHDWKNAKVSFSQSDITNAVQSNPPNYSKLADYLDDLGDEMKKEFESKKSSNNLSNLMGALKAKPLVVQDIATDFALFSSSGIKKSANSDLKKAYDALLTGVLRAIGQEGNKSVDKRGANYVGDNYTATLKGS